MLITRPLLLETMQLSEDGQWMWNGTEWVPAQQQPVQPVQPVAQPMAQAGFGQPVMQQQVPQMAGQVQPQLQAFPQQGMAMVPMEMDTGRKVVPWVGVGLIVISLVLPYISILGFGITGIDMLGYMGEAFEGADALSEDGDDSGGDDMDLGFKGTMFLVAAAMMVFSPLVYLLSAIAGGILIGMNKSPKIPAIIHLGYFGLFIIAASIGTIDIFDESLSVIGFVGIGFYVGSLAPGLWFVDK